MFIPSENGHAYLFSADYRGLPRELYRVLPWCSPALSIAGSLMHVCGMPL
jgi:hypothetical protein